MCRVQGTLSRLPQVARKGTGFLATNDVQAMVSDEEDDEEEDSLLSILAALRFLIAFSRSHVAAACYCTLPLPAFLVTIRRRHIGCSYFKVLTSRDFLCVRVFVQICDPGICTHRSTGTCHRHRDL